MKFTITLGRTSDPIMAGAYLFSLTGWGGAEYCERLISYYPELKPIMEGGKSAALPKLQSFFERFYMCHGADLQDARRRIGYFLNNNGDRIVELCEFAVPEVEVDRITIVVSALPGPATKKGESSIYIPYEANQQELSSWLTHELVHIYLGRYLLQSGLMKEFDSPNQLRLFIELMTDELLRRNNDFVASSASSKYPILERYQSQIAVNWDRWGSFRGKVIGVK